MVYMTADYTRAEPSGLNHISLLDLYTAAIAPACGHARSGPSSSSSGGAPPIDPL